MVLFVCLYNLEFVKFEGSIKFFGKFCSMKYFCGVNFLNL